MQPTESLPIQNLVILRTKRGEKRSVAVNSVEERSCLIDFQDFPPQNG